ncbi:hypothetical protein CERSUDRAFT_82027 [Gelatoporia subvermispora B]|uniref:Alcohol acetyltransferase n=1 Tax=Ceriporiopsis subvermispora (strain B) TaxID=914234 RepID=M2RLE3_CERS8|nr:hypothetical protein CERSUDRAFT_82027 [Gelatoporia subvermispora B]
METKTELPMDSSTSVVAEAGRQEQFHIWKHDLGMDSCVIITAEYRWNGRTIDQPTLFAALTKVISRQPPLAVRFSPDRHHFLRLPTIDLSPLVEFVDDVSLQDVLEAQFLRRFDTDAEAPLWRLVVVNGRTVVFAYQHAIGDGQSGIAFHRALWTALNELEYPITSASYIAIVPEHIELVPPSEKLLDVSVSFTRLCKVLWNSFAPKVLTKTTSWSGGPIPTIPSTKAAVRILEYTPQEAAKILKQCKAHNATLTGLLLALTAAILSHIVAADPSLKRYKTISMSVPITLRRFTGATADTMCNHVSMCHLRPPIQRPETPPPQVVQIDDKLWASAAQLTKKVHGKIATCKQEVGLLKFLYGNYKGFLEERGGRPRGHAFELSNAGLFTPIGSGSSKGGHEEQSPDAAAWTIGQTLFAQCDAVNGSATKLNAIGTPEGGVGLTVQWADGAVDDSIGEAFYAGLREAMQTILS